MEQVFGVAAVNILDAKVVHNKDKDDGPPLVTPQARGSGTLVIAMGRESFGEEVIGQFASLLEAIDAFRDLEVDPVVEGILREIVLTDEFLWDVQ